LRLIYNEVSHRSEVCTSVSCEIVLLTNRHNKFRSEVCRPIDPYLLKIVKLKVYVIRRCRHRGYYRYPLNYRLCNATDILKRKTVSPVWVAYHHSSNLLCKLILTEVNKSNKGSAKLKRLTLNNKRVTSIRAVYSLLSSIVGDTRCVTCKICSPLCVTLCIFSIVQERIKGNTVFSNSPSILEVKLLTRPKERSTRSVKSRTHLLLLSKSVNVSPCV